MCVCVCKQSFERALLTTHKGAVCHNNTHCIVLLLWLLPLHVKSITETTVTKERERKKRGACVCVCVGGGGGGGGG